jgi:hypothetical protein
VGGRRPPASGRDWIRHALEEELERRWEIKMNGVGVPDAYTAAAG